MYKNAGVLENLAQDWYNFAGEHVEKLNVPIFYINVMAISVIFALYFLS